jgi:hypothetical protein
MGQNDKLKDSKIVLGEGSRLNEGKIRFELLEPFAQLQKAQIFTKGAMKYAPNNWLQGMAWSKCYASALRHIAAWARGEDYDIDPNCEKCKEGTKDKWVCTNHTGELHSALAAWNMDAITSYYKHFPQGDDRLHMILPKPRIGLDVDEVVCNWVDHWCELYKIPIPSSWNFQWDIKGLFDKMRQEGTLDEFYAGLTPCLNPNDLPFEPVAYISHRPVAEIITKNWLEKHGFPLKPVYHVKERADKVKLAKELKIDIFVDDSYETYKAMNEAGICCYLKDALHNRRYDVGYRRIKSLKDLVL